MALPRISLARALRGAGAGVLDAIVPRRCGLCGRFDTFLCAECAAGLPPARPPRCPTCCGSLAARRDCRRCAAVLVQPLDGMRAPFLLEDSARRLVHALKYDGLSALAEPMGRLIAASLHDWGIRPDVVLPVPLHGSRRRWRGFNQSELVARSCAAATDLPMRADLLRRVRATPQQVRASGIEAREANVAGAFAATGAVTGQTVLLVDDVCTTGATLRACASALRAAGARRVYGLTFATED